MKKQHTALIAALIITIFIAAGVFAIGGAAFVNTNGTQVSNVQGQSYTAVNASAVSGQPQVQQIQTQLMQANTQLALAEQQLQQYQNLVTTLQQQGMITVTSNGQVFINGQYH